MVAVISCIEIDQLSKIHPYNLCLIETHHYYCFSLVHLDLVLNQILPLFEFHPKPEVKYCRFSLEIAKILEENLKA